jgi:hypothetical protein
MKLKIGRTTYDTDNATNAGRKYVGELGQPDGFEEALFVTEKGKLFLYGAGGAESPYSEASIQPLTEAQAAKWKNAFSLEKATRKRTPKAKAKL